jgi:hypothetical protein
MKKDLRVLLLRGQSETSKKAEDFLKENNYQYDVLYGDESEEMPIIFPPNSSVSYTGERGLKIFQHIYKKRA